MISDARKVVYSASQSVFFDANVWLSLYAPPSGVNNYWKGEYSKVLSLIVAGNAPVLIDATVISEYINRYCRIEFQAYEEYAHPQSSRTFKDFRIQDLDTYRPIADSAAEGVREMLEIPSIRRVNDNFADRDIRAMLDDFSSGENDWNDLQIADLCRQNDCALLTNDADFEDSDIEVLTCNKRLLQNAASFQRRK